MLDAKLLTAYPTRIMTSMRNSADTSDNGRRTAPAAPTSPGRRAALYGVLTAAALVCGYLELLIPLPVTVPGVKLGLGNIVILMALERLGAKAGLFLMFIKVIASTLLFANLQMLVFSLAGGLLGRRLGCLFQKRAELAGGLVLIGIGFKILGEHLG